MRQELRVCNYRGYEEEVEDEDGEGRRIELEGLQVRCKRRESEEDCFDRGVEGEEVPELFLGRAFWRPETGWCGGGSGGSCAGVLAKVCGGL